jgi:hypothetical protein
VRSPDDVAGGSVVRDIGVAAAAREIHLQQ